MNLSGWAKRGLVFVQGLCLGYLWFMAVLEWPNPWRVGVAVVVTGVTGLGFFLESRIREKESKVRYVRYETVLYPSGTFGPDLYDHLPVGLPGSPGGRRGLPSGPPDPLGWQEFRAIAWEGGLPSVQHHPQGVTITYRVSSRRVFDPARMLLSDLFCLRWTRNSRVKHCGLDVWEVLNELA